MRPEGLQLAVGPHGHEIGGPAIQDARRAAVVQRQVGEQPVLHGDTGAPASRAATEVSRGMGAESEYATAGAHAAGEGALADRCLGRRVARLGGEQPCAATIEQPVERVARAHDAAVSRRRCAPPARSAHGRSPRASPIQPPRRSERAMPARRQGGPVERRHDRLGRGPPELPYGTEVPVGLEEDRAARAAPAARRPRAALRSPPRRRQGAAKCPRVGRRLRMRRSPRPRPGPRAGPPRSPTALASSPSRRTRSRPWPASSASPSTIRTSGRKTSANELQLVHVRQGDPVHGELLAAALEPRGQTAPRLSIERLADRRAQPVVEEHAVRERRRPAHAVRSAPGPRPGRAPPRPGRRGLPTPVGAEPAREASR